MDSLENNLNKLINCNRAHLKLIAKALKTILHLKSIEDKNHNKVLIIQHQIIVFQKANL